MRIERPLDSNESWCAKHQTEGPFCLVRTTRNRNKIIRVILREAAMAETQAPTPTLRLGHVVLKMQDLEKAKGFYRDILGIKITEERADFGVLFLFEDYHHDIAVFKVQRRCPAAGAEPGRPVPSGPGHRLPGDRQGDVTAAKGVGRLSHRPRHLIARLSNSANPAPVESPFPR